MKKRNIFGLAMASIFTMGFVAADVTYAGNGGDTGSGGKGIISGEVTEGTCTEALTGDSKSELYEIDWEEYLNFKVGRAWQYKLHHRFREKTLSEYVKKITTMDNKKVYVKGWSKNWSEWLDYWNFKSDGVYMVANYDEELNEDVMINPPALFYKSRVKLGKYYSQTVDYNGETIEIKTKYELVDGITVPYGTYDDVIKLTRKISQQGTDIEWYAKNIGRIKTNDGSSNRIEKLLKITDGSSRPSD